MEFTCEATSWTFFGWEFLFVCFVFTDSITLLVNWHVLIFYFFLTQSWEIMFPGICPFLLGCPFYWQIVLHSTLLYPLCFCGISCNFSFFISDFPDLGPLFFLIIYLEFYQLCLSFQRTSS